MSHNSALVMNACLQENLSWASTILTVLTLKPCQADAIYYFYYLSVIVPSTAILMINIIISIYYIMVLPSNMTIENRIIPRTLNLNFMIWSLRRWLSTRHEWVSEAVKVASTVFQLFWFTRNLIWLEIKTLVNIQRKLCKPEISNSHRSHDFPVQGIEPSSSVSQYLRCMNE